jgi:hypothetical protein
MKFIYTLTLVCFSSIALKAQTQIPHPAIKQFLIDMNDDSVLNNLKELSGEKTCIVKGKTTTIKNRVSKNGNDLAADYLRERLEAYGFTVTDQKYSTGGRNIFAEQKGEVYPDKKFIIGAHYDSMADYCADDNASGCSTVLEVIRVLSKHKFKYTIVYGFWDEEELGLLGSAYYAKLVKKNNENIMGAINMDMIAYDNNNDSKFEIHTKAGSSLALSDKIQQINTSYAFKLSPIVKNPGTDRSDHASFWTQGYPAIHFGEAFFSGDGNPQYHKSTDRINILNLPYYYQLSRLGMSTMATLAEPYDVTGIDDNVVVDKIKLQAYPNPARESVTINYELQETTALQIRLYNPLNEAAEVIINQTESAGIQQHNINTSKLASGIYFIVITTPSQTHSSKIIIEK